MGGTIDVEYRACSEKIIKILIAMSQSSISRNCTIHSYAIRGCLSHGTRIVSRYKLLILKFLTLVDYVTTRITSRYVYPLSTWAWPRVHILRRCFPSNGIFIWTRSLYSRERALFAQIQAAEETLSPARAIRDSHREMIG